MTMRSFRNTAAGLTLLASLGAAPLEAANPRASARLAPNPVGMSEAAILEITVEGADIDLYFDATFRLEHLDRQGGPSHTTRVQIVNGVPSNSRSLSWRLRPTDIGTGRVFDIQVQIGDKTLDLDPVSTIIQEEPTRPQQARRRRDPFDGLDDPFDRLFGRRPRRPREAPKVFLRAEASPREAWVGQQVVYTLYLYTQVDVLGIPFQEMPDFKGFWAREIPHPEPRPPEMVQHDGEDFARFVLEQRALFPRRDGSFELVPAQSRLVVRDSSFRSLLASTSEIDRTSNAITLEIRPLPEAPPGFDGAVGRLTLDATLEPRDLAVGDAATLTVRLEGNGHLQGLPEPALTDLPGIKVFPPQQQASERVRGRTVVGSRTWSFVLVPERPGEWTLPPVEIPYFDPRAGAFTTAKVDGLALTARGATSLPQSDGETVSLHPIRNAALPAAQMGARFDDAAPWLFGLPWLITAVALVGRRRAERGGRSARRTLLEQLKDAGRHDDPRRAAATVEDAWRAYLEQRWEIPTGTPSPRWREALTAHGVAGPEADQLVKLADDLHYLRYAPKLSSTDDLRRELLERSRKLARSLR